MTAGQAEASSPAACLVYVTAASTDEAVRIGRAAVEERLAASANVIPGVQSIYRWKGRIEEAGEAVLILKTRQDLAEALTARVKALHAYEVPCIVALPILSGNPDYLAWLAAETAGERRQVPT